MRFIASTVTALALAMPFAGLVAATPAPSTVLHVAPAGHDTWSGRTAQPSADRIDGPFATLEHARNTVRALAAAGLRQPVEVVLHGGTYELPRTLVFEPSDSGTKECPITWRAAEGERVVIRGTKKVGGWKPWQGKILQADLGAQGLGGISIHQLFYQSTGTTAGGFAQRLVLARYPNFDPQHPRTGGFLYAAADAPKEKRGRELIYRSGDLPLDQWPDLAQAELVSAFWRSWHFCTVPILGIDRDRHALQVPQVRSEFFKLNHYFIQNIREALDQPGEWYLDRKTGILYLWPPEDGAMGDVLVPVLDHLIAVQGALPYPYEVLNIAYQGTREAAQPPKDAPAPHPVQFLRFAGLDFECAEQDAVRLSGARDCDIVSCRATNVGNIGFNLGAVTTSTVEEGNPRRIPFTGHPGGSGHGGHNLLYNDPCERCRVISCDVWATGCEGILVFGQDNLAENNHVHDIGLYSKDAPCIGLHGDRNTARRNTVHDCPRCGIFVKGVDTLVELNDIHHCALETIDMSGIYIVQRNAHLRGNVFRHNRIADVQGYGFDYEKKVRYATGFFTWDIYLDDYTCGTLVEGNILLRASKGGIMCNGGGDNLLRGNIIVDQNEGGLLFRQMNRHLADVKDVSRGNRAENNVIAFHHAPDFEVYRFGAYQDYSIFPTFENNLFWSAAGPGLQIRINRAGAPQPEIIRDLHAWLQRGLDRGSRVADPRFVGSAADDFRLQPDSPAWALGFKPIPVDQIGCYDGAGRREWPLQNNHERWREDPVLYSVAPDTTTPKESNLPQ